MAARGSSKLRSICPGLTPLERRLRPVIGSIIFFVLAPGVVAGVVPYLLSRWRLHPPFLAVEAGRWIGVTFVAAGLAVLVDSFSRFALEGVGTPAPVAPTKTLVVSGLY